MQGLTGETFGLPTEADWELACRAGTTTPYYTGTRAEALRLAGWCGSVGTRAARIPLPNP